MAQTVDKLERLKQFTRLANNNPSENEANVAARRACKLLEEMNWQLPIAIGPSNQQQNQQRANPNPNVSNPYGPFSGGGYWDDPFADLYNRTRQRSQRQYDQQKADQAKREQERKEQENYHREQYRKEQEAKQRQKEEDNKRRQYQNDFSQFIKDQQRDSKSPFGDMRADPKFWSTQKEYIQYMKERFIHLRDNPQYTEVKYGSYKYTYHDVETDKTTTEYRESTYGNASKRRTLHCNKCKEPIETGFMGPESQFTCFRCQFNEHNQKTEPTW